MGERSGGSATGGRSESTLFMSSSQTDSQRRPEEASNRSPLMVVRVSHQRPSPSFSPAWKTRRSVPRGVPPTTSERLMERKPPSSWASSSLIAFQRASTGTSATTTAKPFLPSRSVTTFPTLSRAFS